MQSEPEKHAQEATGSETRYLREAARRLFPRRHSVSVLGELSGFSGSAFARVEASGRSWCLRRWPSDFEERRLRFIHLVLSESRSRSFAGVPKLAKTDDGETVLTLAGRLYDAQEWLVGEPLSRVRPSGGPMPNVVVSLSPARISNLAAALAYFHLSTVHLSSEHGNDASPLSARLTRLSEDAKAHHDALLSDVRIRAEGEERHIALRWLALLPEVVEAAREASKTLPEEASGQYALCHGDIWPAHVHFDGDTFVGFTDFESLCSASPALDLAQLVLHFGGWEIREDVLRSYETVAPLTERDRTALPIEAVTDLVSEGFWSLEALYGDASSMTASAQRAAHALNLRELVESLEQVAEDARAIGS